MKKAKNKMEKLYRYTTNGEGVFSTGKRLLPKELVDEVLEAKKWLIKPNLNSGNYRFYLTQKGREMYKKTLYYLIKNTCQILN